MVESIPGGGIGAAPGDENIQAASIGPIGPECVVIALRVSAVPLPASFRCAEIEDGKGIDPFLVLLRDPTAVEIELGHARRFPSDVRCERPFTLLVLDERGSSR